MTLTSRDIFRLTAAVPLALAVLLFGVPNNSAVRGAGIATAGYVGSTRGGASLRRMSNGKIAFVSYDGAPILDVINPDGTGFRQLTPRCFREGGGCTISEIAWSPGGKRIAFLRGYGPSDQSLFVINADGSGEKRLARCGADCPDLSFSRLSWSPDGSRIVFSRGGLLSIVDVNDGTLQRLTNCSAPSLVDEFGRWKQVRTNGCYDWSPAWSPDGSRIVLSRNASRLDLIHADGSRL